MGLVEGGRMSNILRIGNDLPEDINKCAYTVIGAAIEVHRTLGAGHLEQTYEEALVIELLTRGMSYRRQASFAVDYKGTTVGIARVDLIVEDKLIVELKSVENVLPIHRAQVRSYLKAARYELGLLINFNVGALRDGIHRVILTNAPDN
jgi:GxxExxY protein